MIKANEQIPDLVVGTLDGLGRLCALLEAQDRPSQSCAQSYLARFKLWAGSLGAHRTSGTRSLEYRLRDASSIRKHLVSLLQELRDLVVEEALASVQFGPGAEVRAQSGGDSVDDELAALFDTGAEDRFGDLPPAGHNNELTDLLFGIGRIIDCLLRFSVTISNPAPYDHFRSRAGVNLTHHFEHYDTLHVRAKYPRIQPKLSERLGRMLAYRRRYFKYREDHHARLEEGLERALDDATSKGQATTVASSVPQECKDDAQVHLAGLKDDYSEVSATSYVPSTLGQSELRVPPIPKQYIDGPFLCPFCYVFVSVDNRHDWKKHVFRDLRPYACLVDTCVVDHDFQRRKDWTDHMLQDHWRAWACPFGCTGEYSSSPGLRDHLQERHTSEVAGQDVEATVNLSSRTDVSRAEGPCPLCHEVEIKSKHQYQSHVGHHLEQLALFVLPTQEDNDDEHESSDDWSSPSRDTGLEPEKTTQLHQPAMEQEDEEVGKPVVDDEELRSSQNRPTRTAELGEMQALDSGRWATPKVNNSSLFEENDRRHELAQRRNQTLQDLDNSLGGSRTFTPHEARATTEAMNVANFVPAPTLSTQSSFYGGDVHITPTTRYESIKPQQSRDWRGHNDPVYLGESGYEYTNPGDLARYDLDNGEMHTRRRRDSFDRDTYHHSSVNVGIHGGRQYEGRVGTPPPSTDLDSYYRRKAGDTTAWPYDQPVVRPSTPPVVPGPAPDRRSGQLGMPPSPDERADRTWNRRRAKDKDEDKDTGKVGITEKVATGLSIAAGALGLGAMTHQGEDEEEQEEPSRRHADDVVRKDEAEERQKPPGKKPDEQPVRRDEAEERQSREGEADDADDKERNKPWADARLSGEPPTRGARDGSSSDESKPGQWRTLSSILKSKDTAALMAIKEQLKAQQESGKGHKKVAGVASGPYRPSQPSLSIKGPDSGDDARGRDTAIDRDDERVRFVSPPRDKDDKKVVKGILKQPKTRFPEEPNPAREGAAPHKDDKSRTNVPPGARWTKINRKLVNPEALTIGKERFEVRDDFVIVLRVLNREEIEAYGAATAQLREMRRQTYREQGRDRGGDRDGGGDDDDDGWRSD